MTTLIGNPLPDEARIVREAHTARARYVGRTIARLFAGLGRAFARWRRRQRELAQLRALDDRTLHDLGMSRTDILYAFRHGRPADAANRNEKTRAA